MSNVSKANGASGATDTKTTTTSTTLSVKDEERIMTEIKKTVDAEKRLIDPNTLSDDQKNKVKDFKDSISIGDSNSILQYGVGAQKDLSDFTSSILQKVRTKDAGQVGDILTNLATEVKQVDVDSFISHRKSFLASIPGIGKFFDELEKFKTKYKSIEENINSITDKLEKEYEVLLRDIVVLEELYKENMKYYEVLDLLIYAAEEKLDELEADLVSKEAEYKNNNDEFFFQEIQNLRNFVDQLETRLHDLKLTRISTLQSFPQINLIKSGNQALAGKIQSAILNTVPLWKRHITVAIGIHNQKAVAEHLQQVDKTTDDLLKSNSELLKESSTTVAKTLQRGIISIETLQTVHTNLVESIDEVRKIVDEGKAERKAASDKMQVLEKELKDKVANYNKLKN